MLNNYQSKELHLNTRTEFPDGLKPMLIGGGFTQWKHDPAFPMSGSALHGFHNRLRAACDSLTTELGEVVNNSNRDENFDWPLIVFGKQIISVAHSHHQAEDFVYFPQYKSLYPQLEKPLSLLDGDHRVLETSLDKLESSLSSLQTLSASSNKHDWEQARDDSEQLTHIIHRHLNDEEEIVMPAIMKRDSVK